MSEATIRISEEFVPSCGGTTYVKRWTPEPAGTADVTPIVLLHDSLGCVDMWREFPVSLARGLRRPVIAYDRLGFGRSSERFEIPSTRFVYEEAEAYFPELKERLGVDAFIAFGHSVGGAMAVLIAAQFPSACRAVITEAAQAYVEPKTLAAIAEHRTRFGKPQELAKLKRYHGEKASWVVRAWTETWLSPEFMNWSVVTELPKVRSPLLAVHGEDDEYGSLAFPEVLTRESGGRAEKLILPRCGHVPHREMESVVVEGIDRFLSGNACIGSD